MSTLDLTIATRQSPLALWQAEHVAARLREIEYASARLTETAALFQAMGSPADAALQ